MLCVYYAARSREKRERKGGADVIGVLYRVSLRRGRGGGGGDWGQPNFTMFAWRTRRGDKKREKEGVGPVFTPIPTIKGKGRGQNPAYHYDHHCAYFEDKEGGERKERDEHSASATSEQDPVLYHPF